VANDPALREFVTSRGIEWRHITEKAPWRGALYERLIGLVKHNLRRVIGRKTIDFEGLETLFVETEGIVNRRPLTTILEGEIDRPLRPVDFLQPLTDANHVSEPIVDLNQSTDPDVFLDRDKRRNETEKLTKLYRFIMLKVEHFWEVWRTDYLLALRDRWKNNENKGVIRSPIIGELIIIHDEQLPRSVWKIGRVTEVLNSRTVTLKTIPKGAIIRRAVEHVYPLELGDDMADEGLPEDPVNDQEEPVSAIPKETSEPLVNVQSIEDEPRFPARTRRQKRDPNFWYDLDENNTTASAIRSWNKPLSHNIWVFIVMIIAFFVCLCSGSSLPYNTSLSNKSTNMIKHTIPQESNNIVWSETQFPGRVRPSLNKTGLWRIELKDTGGGMITFRSLTKCAGERRRRVFRLQGPGDSKLKVGDVVSAEVVKPPKNRTTAATTTTIKTTVTPTTTSISTATSTPCPPSKVETKAPRYPSTVRTTTSTPKTWPLMTRAWTNKAQSTSTTVRATMPTPRWLNPRFNPRARMSALKGIVGGTSVLASPIIGPIQEILNPQKDESSAVRRETSRVIDKSGFNFHPRTLDTLGDEQKGKETNFFFCRTKTHTLWRVPQENAVCNHLPDLFDHGRNETVTLYARRMLPISIKAYICAKKVETVRFYVNFWGDRFSEPKVERLKVGPAECRDIMKYKTCAEGPLIRSGDTDMYATNKKIDIEFPGRLESFFRGAKEVQVTNCYIEETEIFLSTDTLKISSPTHDVHRCSFEEETCEIDGLRMVWESHCGKTRKCTPCAYAKVREVEGTLSPKIFIMHDSQMSLTFGDKAEKAMSCDGIALRISEQGFGIKEEEWRRSLVPVARTRMKRGWVSSETLAAELEGFSVHLAEAITKVFQTECQMGAYMLDDPTKMARKLMRRQDVMARWVTQSLLQVFPCAKVELKEIEFRKMAEKCYRYIPVRINMTGIGKIDMFLDPELRLLSMTSPEADCRLYRTHFLEVGDSVAKYDSIEGTLTQVGKSDIHLMPPGVKVIEQDLSISHFHDLVLSNDSAVVQMIYNAHHVEELKRESSFASEEEIHATSRSEQMGAVPHSVPGLIKAYYLGYLTLIHDIYREIALAVVWIVIAIGILSVCLPAGVSRAINGAGRVAGGMVRLGRSNRQLPPSLREAVSRPMSPGSICSGGLDFQSQEPTRINRLGWPRVTFSRAPRPQSEEQDDAVQLQEFSRAQPERVSSRAPIADRLRRLF
jgi:hypothetical protein